MFTYVRNRLKLKSWLKKVFTEMLKSYIIPPIFFQFTSNNSIFEGITSSYFASLIKADLPTKYS